MNNHSSEKIHRLPERFTNLVGWLPAIVFPGASSLQLIKIIQTSDSSGISISTWLLFSIANVGMYLYTEKFFAPQALALLLTALLQAAIVVTALIT